jgi:hypothetical protein
MSTDDLAHVTGLELSSYTSQNHPPTQLLYGEGTLGWVGFRVSCGLSLTLLPLLALLPSFTRDFSFFPLLGYL